MRRIIAFSSPRELARAAAKDWFDLLARTSGPHLAALSGGHIALDFFDAATELARSSNTSLRQVHFFWADERCVPPTDSESNFLLASDHLLKPLNIAPDKIHRLKGELPSAAAVAEANMDIRATAPVGPGGLPILDLIFLGMGENGHIASLMPDAPAEVEQSREPYVHVPNSPKPPPNRLSLTYPMLAAAREVWVLVSGQGKEEAFHETLRPDGATPLARVLRERGQTRLYSDLG